MCPDTPPSLMAFYFLIGGITLFCTEQNQEEEMGSIKRESERNNGPFFGVGLLPCLESVLSAVCLMKDLSAWNVADL